MTGKHHQKVKSVGQWHGEPRAQSGGNRPDRRQGVMGQSTEPSLISAAGPNRENLLLMLVRYVIWKPCSNM